MKPIFPTAVQHAADVVRHIFQIPLVHEPVDLPRFFVSFAGGVRVVNDAYEPYPPGGEQTVDVFFHQFQFTGEPRLCLAQHDIEFVLLRVPQQTVELRAPPVRACIVVVTINVENVPSLFHRILQQHRFLRRDLSRYVFAKECAIRIDKQQKECYNNAVIDNDVII